MYLIDTDIIIWVLRNNSLYVNLLQELKFKSPISISAVTVAEIYKNILPTETIKTEELINKMILWDVTVQIGKQAGLYWQLYNRQLKKLHILDCMIAATANINDLTLVTLNTRHFPMKDIKVMDPLKKRN